MCDTALEEFLEELDALTDPEAEESKASPEPLPPRASEDAGADPGQASTPRGKTETSAPRSAEKKVRFSEEPISGSPPSPPRPSHPEPGCVSSLKASSHATKQGPRPSGESGQQGGAGGAGGPRDEGGGPCAPPAAEHQPADSERSGRSSELSAATRPPSAPPTELAKCSVSSTHAGVQWFGLS